jgi:hypothetical protein
VHGYLTYQQEKAPDTGKLHWQGYVEFRLKRRLTSIKKLPGYHARAHWEPRRASAAEASAYCHKDETAVPGTRAEFGVLSANGVTRSYSSAVAAVRKRGYAGISDVVDKWPEEFVKHHRGLRELANEVASSLWGNEPRTVHVYWGPTGSGKSRAAWDMASPEMSFHSVSYTDVAAGWFPGYAGQAILCIEEWQICQDLRLLSRLLTITDRYKCTVPVKGSHVAFLAKVVVITSNSPPEAWFPMISDVQRDALFRRITTVKQFGA